MIARCHSSRCWVRCSGPPPSTRAQIHPAWSMATFSLIRSSWAPDSLPALAQPCLPVPLREDEGQPPQHALPAPRLKAWRLDVVMSVGQRRQIDRLVVHLNSLLRHSFRGSRTEVSNHPAPTSCVMAAPDNAPGRHRHPPAATPVPATTPATGIVLLVIFVKIIGVFLPTSGTFSSNDHSR
jgi:hypothetical protein